MKASLGVNKVAVLILSQRLWCPAALGARLIPVETTISVREPRWAIFENTPQTFGLLDFCSISMIFFIIAELLGSNLLALPFQ